MGRWSPGYSDDVVLHKVKNMVTAAISRAMHEADTPKITYEMFAQELNEGDSFTARLFDVLVMEVASRSSRPSISERILIAGKTSETLQELASTKVVSRDLEYPAQGLWSEISEMTPIPDLTDEDDAEEETYLEGARLNHSLYDVYRMRPSIPMRSFPAVSSRYAEENFEGRWTPRDTSTVNRSPPPRASTSHVANATLLTRQSSIRRPNRSRAIDFDDFASRRRSSFRSSAGQDTDITAAHSSSTPWGQNNSLSRTILENSYPRLGDEMRYSGEDTNPEYISSSRMAGDSDIDPPATFVPAHWHSQRSTGSSRQPLFPRLRRGGLRPPESLVANHFPFRSIPPTPSNDPGSTNTEGGPATSGVSSASPVPSVPFSGTPTEETPLDEANQANPVASLDQIERGTLTGSS